MIYQPSRIIIKEENICIHISIGAHLTYELRVCLYCLNIWLLIFWLLWRVEWV